MNILCVSSYNIIQVTKSDLALLSVSKKSMLLYCIYDCVLYRSVLLCYCYTHLHVFSMCLYVYVFVMLLGVLVCCYMYVCMVRQRLVQCTYHTYPITGMALPLYMELYIMCMSMGTLLLCTATCSHSAYTV